MKSPPSLLNLYLFYRFVFGVYARPTGQSGISSNMTSATRHRPPRFLLDSESGTPPRDGSSTRSSYPKGNEANFDTNMVIILAALLCALICALGLNSIVRCAIRCSRRFALETEDETAARLASTTGLKRRALREIPVWVYGSGEINKIPSSDCPICLAEFVEGEKVRVLPKCNHGFHVRCIDTWLLSRSSCPTCRQSLVEAVDGVVDVNHGNSSADDVMA